MSGEVSNKQRPLNSLLDENVDFGVSLTKGAIQEIISPEYGHTLEEKIRQIKVYLLKINQTQSD